MNGCKKVLFFFFDVSFVNDLSGPKLTKLKIKLYYLPKVIRFADEKLNFQQDKVTLQVPVQYCWRKKVKSAFIR